VQAGELQLRDNSPCESMKMPSSSRSGVGQDGDGEKASRMKRGREGVVAGRSRRGGMGAGGGSSGKEACEESWDAHAWTSADDEAYTSELGPHRFKTIPLLEMVEDGKATFDIDVNNRRAEETFSDFGSSGLGQAYSGRGSALSRAQTVRGRMARIASELASLATNLPVEVGSSIFVRVDEDRPDVIKALIVGPEDTPYENGVLLHPLLLLLHPLLLLLHVTLTVSAY
jgi:hypothetical protein